MPKVCLIRHAESEANAGGQSQDPVTIRLSSNGVQTAKLIAEGFSVPPSLILASRYLRTQQTAQPLLDKFPTTAHEVWDIQEFTYLSPPKYRNTTMLERLPAANSYWAKGDPLYRDGEGAESFTEFAERCRKVVEKLRSKSDDLILAFSHEQFITGIQWHLAGHLSNLNQKTIHDFRAYLMTKQIKNCGIVEVDLISRNKNNVGFKLEGKTKVNNGNTR